MPLGVVEFRDTPDGNRRVRKPFISGTSFEITDNVLRQTGWGALSRSEVEKNLDIEYDVQANKVADLRRYAVAPVGVRRILESQGCGHPGLALDKFIYRSADQSFVKHALQKIVEVSNTGTSDAAWFLNLRDRWMTAVNPGNVPHSLLHCATVGPLTLHLARASASENAGICLHPLYGFAYLPGSGLKGMSRAYAETIWLPAQPDQKQAWRQIEDVFGWAPNPDRRQQINDANHPAEIRREDDNDPKSPEIKASSGNIVFHDAWPESWPQLIVDIVNNHHPDYYQHDDNDHPPGDWENPVPVYFLAVKPGTTFAFPLTNRRADVDGELLSLAKQWLLGALCHLGAGAKTVAGYGAFKSVGEETPALPSANRVVFESTLELVTPAFLAGANQQAEDCDLRSATLRGLLRWWWRTMHAGFMDVKTFRALEAAIWGDTHGTGAIRIVIEKVNESQPQPYDKRSKANFNEQQKRSPHGIANEDPRKTTQGLWYTSYGMDEGNPSNRRRRHCLEPGARWKLRLISRPTRYYANRKDVGDSKKGKEGTSITAEQALSQAKAALWLLCHYGAVGSKARKGFGSLTTDRLQGYTLEVSRNAANQFRQDLELPNGFDENLAHSPSVQQMLNPVEVSFSRSDSWSVLDQVGFAYQTFAKKYKHQREKMALGLPRRIGSPVQGQFNPTPPVTASGRHSSPVHIHIERRDDGWTVRVIAFPAAHLPDLATSRTFLEEFLKDFADELRRRSQLQPPSGPSGSASSLSVAGSPSAAGPIPVRVKFLGPHGGLKDAFWVQEQGKKRGLLKYGKRPDDKDMPAVDSEIQVYRTNNNPNSPEYRWDPPPTNPPSGGYRPSGRR